MEDRIRDHSRDGTPRFGRRVMKRASFHYTRITHSKPHTYGNFIKRSSHHEEEKKFNSVMRQITRRSENKPPGYQISAKDDTCLDDDDSDSDDSVWRETTSKKSLKKLDLMRQEFKRQENIIEFIEGERNHLELLKVLQKTYAKGLIKELGMDKTTINKLFPMIEEHVAFSTQLVERLKERQAVHKVVSGIGDILFDHFDGSNGETMKRLFGNLCSKEGEILIFYKDMLKNDKKFAAFIKRREKLPRVKRQDFTSCLLAITQRINKYPSIVQTLLEYSNASNHCDDHDNLVKTLTLSQDLVKNIEEQTQVHRRKILLLETHQNIDNKSFTSFKNRKFVGKDLLKSQRKLLFSANLQMNMPDSKKPLDLFALVLSDCLIFLQELNGKYVFLSGQPAAVPLEKMIVRETATDDRGLFLISMIDERMYSLKLSTAENCIDMAQAMRLAIEKCSDEDEGITSEEEERKIRHRQIDKARQTVTYIEKSDKKINKLLMKKTDIFRNLSEMGGRKWSANISIDVTDVDSDSDIISRLDDSTLVNGSKPLKMLGIAKRDLKRPDEGLEQLHFVVSKNLMSNSTLSPVRHIPKIPSVLKAVEQVNKFTLAVYGAGKSPRLSFRPSDPGTSHSRPSAVFVKRSDTFGGFDHSRLPLPKPRQFNASHSDSRLNGIGNDKSGSRSLDSIPDESDATQETANKKEEVQDSTNEPEKDLVFCDLSPKPVPRSNTSGMISIDQQNTLTELAHAVTLYQAFAAQQDTFIERLKFEIAQEDINIKKQTFGLLETELKRNHIKQQELKENLNRQKELLQTEEEEWVERIAKEQEELAREKEEINNEKEAVDKEKDELLRERLELQKKLEELALTCSNERVLLRHTPRISHKNQKNRIST